VDVEDVSLKQNMGVGVTCGGADKKGKEKLSL